MKDSAQYTDSDAQQFAALNPKSLNSKSLSAKRINNPPEIRTRQNYTDKDLEKFQKMFATGLAPERPAKTSTEPQQGFGQKTDYSVTDEQQFQRIAASEAPQKNSTKLTKGGRIEERAKAGSYSAQDLAQFEALTAQVHAPSKSDMKVGGRSREIGPSESGNPRKWRFPELHEATSSISSSSSSSAPRPVLSGKSIPMRPGEGRLKLRHFD